MHSHHQRWWIEAALILAIDADDTLFDENNAIRQFMNDVYGFTHTANDYLIEGPFDKYWELIWRKTPEESNAMYEAFASSTYKENLKPIDGALRVLHELKKTYELVIVTSRGQRDVTLTHDAISLHYPNIFSDVHFVPLWGSDSKATKAVICNDIGANYLIDDSFGHCQLAAESGIQALLFGNYGWNRQQVVTAGMVRCKDWDDVRQFLTN